MDCRSKQSVDWGKTGRLYEEQGRGSAQRPRLVSERYEAAEQLRSLSPVEQMKVFENYHVRRTDTCYYLDSGHSVVAVETNPRLCEKVGEKLRSYVRAGILR